MNKIIIKNLFFGFLVIVLLVSIGISKPNFKKTAITNKIETVQKNPVKPTIQPKYNDFHLEISKLNISVPIIADVDGNNKKIYDAALRNGVAQFSGSAKPGESNNIFIFGHSSFYYWDPGKYKTIFASLGDLNNNDEISVWYNQKEYTYKVTEIETINPNNVSVLKPTSSEQLTLMTCWPPGTTQKRLVVIAKPF